MFTLKTSARDIMFSPVKDIRLTQSCSTNIIFADYVTEIAEEGCSVRKLPNIGGTLTIFISQKFRLCCFVWAIALSYWPDLQKAGSTGSAEPNFFVKFVCFSAKLWAFHVQNKNSMAFFLQVSWIYIGNISVRPVKRGQKEST